MGLGYDAAVRLSLLDIRSGLYKHPRVTSEEEKLTLEQACYRGIIDKRKTAIRDLISGKL